jgi:hypothetical protein
MAVPDLKPALDRMVQTIATRMMYSGNRIPVSVMNLIRVEIHATGGGGVSAPFWLGVLQRGRGARKSTTDSGLWKRIYGWMEKRSMFKARTAEGKIAEAKGMTWYINKYGNKQFREKAFVDIYEQARQQCEREVMTEYGLAINNITKDIM